MGENRKGRKRRGRKGKRKGIRVGGKLPPGAEEGWTPLFITISEQFKQQSHLQ